MNTKNFYPVWDENGMALENPTLKYTLANGLPDDWFQAPANADAGYDLKFNGKTTFLQYVKDSESLHTGVFISIPKGYVGIIKDRSSVAVKGVFTVGGVIDSGYTGEIKVLFLSSECAKLQLQHGDKIAQLVILPILTLPLQKVDNLEETERGGNGFGSTGR